jgi:hypothetical protein
MRDLDTGGVVAARADILQLAFRGPRGDEGAAAARACIRAIPPVRDDLGDALSREPGRPLHRRPARGSMARAGAHPRGYVLGRRREHGWRPRPGAPRALGAAARCRARSPSRAATIASWRPVVRDEVTVLDCELIDPEAISGGDVQYISLGDARARRRSRAKPNPSAQSRSIRATRSRRRSAAAAPACDPRERSGVERRAPAAPAIRSRPTGDDRATPTCRAYRFVMDTEIPVVRGTRRIRESREE